MHKTLVVHPDNSNLKKEIAAVISNFEDYNDILGDAERNIIKNVTLNDRVLTIKSFKIPNVVNQIAYRFFRKSKAERSYRYAMKLIDLGVKTPLPVAYQIEFTRFLFKRSYYISEFVNADLTYRELTTDFSIKDHEAILRAFTRFTYQLHKKGVHFLDHSPGNTLIERTKEGYNFYLVDLNRMEFGTLDLDTRLKNFSKLTIHKPMIEVMANEYAKCTGEDEAKIFNAMWNHTKAFQDRFYRKIRIKKRVFFWKKKYKNRVSESPIK
ncbi:Kdo domain containing protein [Hyunsoonleella flava]|uniref:Kdo domain containing protein n=1 Tax=Hyunsoonleella flava TaxID=2527939 RepID=A0A4Q9FLE0_9FLAO|nr:lipopolysaccharide kinase InaA family protein [Hyunsoonleella flava]TBN06410.1 Kdo domain containing protein [Hyunsoonleella flava]